MEIKRSDLKLEKFTMLACEIVAIPSQKKVTIEKLKDVPVELDFDILMNSKNGSKLKILLELKSNEITKPLPGYRYAVVCEAEYNIKGLAKKSDDQKNRYILFTALPLAIAMVRSHLYTVTSNFLHGHYMLPSIDLLDLFEKKFVAKNNS